MTPNDKMDQQRSRGTYSHVQKLNSPLIVCVLIAVIFCFVLFFIQKRTKTHLNVVGLSIKQIQINSNI